MSRDGWKRPVRALLSRRIKAHRILGGPLRGSRIVTSWHDYPAAIMGTTETALLRWFGTHVHEGETWLDVGAHYGYTSLALCRLVGRGGRVFAFEPSVSTAGHLNETRRINRLDNLIVMPFGLAAGGPMRLVRVPMNRGMAEHTPGRYDWTENILVAELDAIWDGLGERDSTVSGIKLDVQGMEIDVLRGLSGLLRRCHPVLLVEVHAGVDRSQLTAVLAAAGYRLPGEPLLPQVSTEYGDNLTYIFRVAGAEEPDSRY
jgi:FkbM family methyltransferase